MKTRGSEHCPVCPGRMFPGDIVCRACERRVRAVRPDLLGDFANRDITDVARGFYLRGQIVGQAMRHYRGPGRPAKTEGGRS